MTVNLKRPALRYSLRAMFVVVALVAIPLTWAAHNMLWIRQRREFVETEKAKWEIRNGHRWSFQLGPEAPAPGYLGWFGERGVSQIPVIVDHAQQEEFADEDRQHIESAKRLFPEAFLHGHYFRIVERLPSNKPGPLGPEWRQLGDLREPAEMK